MCSWKKLEAEQDFTTGASRAEAQRGSLGEAASVHLQFLYPAR